MNRRTGHAHFGNEANDQWKKMAAGLKRIEIATATMGLVEAQSNLWRQEESFKKILRVSLRHGVPAAR
jgi:hypothetical protein